MRAPDSCCGGQPGLAAIGPLLQCAFPVLVSDFYFWTFGESFGGLFHVHAVGPLAAWPGAGQAARGRPRAHG